VSRERITVIDADGRRRSRWSEPLVDAAPYAFMEPANPPSPIERRVLTPDELAARAQAAAALPPIARSVVQRIPEVSAMSAAEPVQRRAPLEALSIAVTEALDADAQLQAARIRWAAAAKALRAAWEGFEGATDTTIEDEISQEVSRPHPREAERMAKSRRNGTEAMLKKRQAPAGSRNGRPDYVNRILAAMVAGGGDRKAAAQAAGLKYDSLVGSLSNIRKRDDLTPAERAAVAPTRKSPTGQGTPIAS
jgi:hypothetical protein